MPTFGKFLITIGYYFLGVSGICLGATWLAVVGAFMAGSATTKLTFELLEKKGQKNETASIN